MTTNPQDIAAIAEGLSDAPRYWTEWSEEDGPVLWWKWPIEEPPYVGSPLDLGHKVQASVQVNTSGGDYAGGEHSLYVGGWPFGDEDGEGRDRLWWTPLPDVDLIDRKIRDDIRGYPEPHTLQEQNNEG